MDGIELKSVTLNLAEISEAGEIKNSNNDNLSATGQTECAVGIDSENVNQNKGDVTFTVDKKGQFEFEVVRDCQNTDNKRNCEVVSSSENVDVKEAVVKIKGPLCADYRSDSDSDSLDSDSSTSTEDFTSETSSDSECSSVENSESEDSGAINIKKEKHKANSDLLLSDLPPIEELRISVPEHDCIEIGTITSIVDTLVVVESYKGIPALDVDTILFLESGKRTLGKVFDILGRITEPVYAVRFNNQEQIKNSQIQKGLKVYCAPKTQHTSFVFVSEILKHKGSDASWKDNIEAPSEFQDFSDDEEERLHKMNKNSNTNEDGSRKRPFSKSTNTVQPVRFRHPSNQSRPKRSPNSEHSHRPFPPFQSFQSFQPFQPCRPLQYNLPHYPGNAALFGGPRLPQMYFPPRFSGPPFPNFAFQGQRIQQPFHQQRTHSVPMSWRAPYVIVPPPPPPPPPSPPATPSTSQQGSQNFEGNSNVFKR